MSDPRICDGNPIFGDWGTAGRAQGAARANVPVGVPCARCSELIVEDDVGEMMPHVDETCAVIRPIHRECLLLGIVGHEYGVCRCTDYAVASSVREAALELYRRVEAKGPSW